jgi:hypothetical protein
MLFRVHQMHKPTSLAYPVNEEAHALQKRSDPGVPIVQSSRHNAKDRDFTL